MSTFETLHCVFTTQVREENGSFVIDVPSREVSLGDIEEGALYRVALLHSDSDAEPVVRESDQSSAIPVEKGETLEVEIEDIGSQGDGLARTDSGYVIFVPETTLRERVQVEVKEARENMAFAEVVGRLDPVN